MEYIVLGSIENGDEDAKRYLYFAMKKVTSTASSSRLSDVLLILTGPLAAVLIFAQVV
jgi:hypothetical protein